MAISVLQRAAGHDTNGVTGSVAVVLASPVTLGSTLIAIGFVDGNSNTPLSTPTDLQSNTYNLIFNHNDGVNSVGIKAWAAYNVAAGVNTVTMSDGNTISSLHVYEVAGLDLSSNFDTSAYQLQQSVTALDSTATGTTAVASELLLGAFISTQSSATFTVGTGYSNGLQTSISALSTFTEEKIVGSTSTYNATATITTNTANELSVILTFKNTENPAVHDNITSSDVIPSYYLDQIDHMDIPTAMLQSYVSVSDTINSSENVNPNVVNLVDVTDTTTTSEFTSVGGLINFNINTSDTIGDSDSVKVFTQLGDIVKSDTIASSENVNLLDELNASVHDNITTTESLGDLDIEMPMISDTYHSSESVGMLISPLVQIANNTSSTTSVTATFGATPGQGNLMVAIVWGNASATSAPTISGWTLQNSLALTGFQTATFFYKKAGASESTSVTANLTNGTAMEIQAAEYAFTGSTIDGASSVADTGVNVTSRSAGSITSSDIDLIVASIGFSGNQGGGLTWTNSFTGRGVGANTAIADYSATVPSTYTTSASWLTGVHAAGFLAAFSKSQTIDVTDTITSSESVEPGLENNPNVSDVITSDDTSVNLFVPGADLIIMVSDSIASSDTPQISGDKVIPVSDTTTTSESLSHYSDQIDANESVVVFLQTGDLNVGVSDQINSSESNLDFSDEDIAVSDSFSSSEFLDVLHNNSRDINLDDTRLLDQNGNPILDENGNFIFDQNPSGDYLYSSENVQAAIATDFFITVSDTISSSEVISVFLPVTRSTSVFDTISSSENISLRPDFIFVTVSDTFHSSENVALSPELNPHVSDTISSSDVPVVAVTPLFITTSDTFHSSENISAVIPTSVIVVKGLPLILLDNGHLAIRLGGNFYQIL